METELNHIPTDQERIDNFKVIQAMHPANRFRLMFGMPLLPESNQSETMKTKPTNHLSDYSRRIIAEIKSEARRTLQAQSVTHIHPRAYCVAKTAPYCAVFVVPPCDNQPLVGGKLSVMVQNHTAGPVNPGDWCALAYISTPGSGQPMVVFTFMPNAKP